MLFCPLVIQAQLNNGGINANFGIDADTKNNYVKYGPLTGIITSDDWFAPSLTGKNIIDTSNAAAYLASLRAGTNISFKKRMSTLLYAKQNGTLWLDAAYGRDYVAASLLKDSTTFTVASKNGDDPANWSGGVSNFPNKNDLVDVFAHMRRDGLTVHDSLWFFTGVSTFGTTGSSYFDVELYKKTFSYIQVTGTFTSAGTQAGHTEWLFDASGNIIQTGDMIVAVNFSPGSVPVVDLRIWVSSTTFSTVIPSYFNFTTSFNGATASPAYGYASIVSKAGTTAWGAGISNLSAFPTQDTTYSTPWGTAGNSATNNWLGLYQSQQFIEVGLNLTRIGVDPALYGTLSPCESLFSNIFFKSRSSNSFTSNMQDFVTPLVFLRPATMDYSINPDTLRCNRPVGTITLTNNSTMGYYTWTTANGNISGSSGDSSQININKPGTYIVSASPAAGCPATRKDTIVIPIDTFPPVASINETLQGLFTNTPYFQLLGGDPVASNYLTPFGYSKGLLWNWAGPNNFSSTIQNPVTTDTAWGNYQLTVTEKRNGCSRTVIKNIDPVEFGILANSHLLLTGMNQGPTILLQWTDKLQSSIHYYQVEKSIDNGSDFISIAKINFNVNGNGLPVSYADINPIDGYNYYRIKSVSQTGLVVYSNIIKVKSSTNSSNNYAIVYTGSGYLLKSFSGKDVAAVLSVYTTTGQLLQRSKIQLKLGWSQLPLSLPNLQTHGAVIISLEKENQLLHTQKLML